MIIEIQFLEIINENIKNQNGSETLKNKELIPLEVINKNIKNQNESETTENRESINKNILN